MAELKALADHAALHVMLYRRRSYVGGGDPERMAELERIAKGAAARLRRAEDLRSPPSDQRHADRRQCRG